MQCGAVFATALGEIGTAATLAAYLRSDMRQEFSRLDALKRLSMHASDQCRATVRDRSQHDHRIAELLLELIDAFAQRLRIDAFQPRRDKFQVAD